MAYHLHPRFDSICCSSCANTVFINVVQNTNNTKLNSTCQAKNKQVIPLNPRQGGT